MGRYLLVFMIAIALVGCDSCLTTTLEQQLPIKVRMLKSHQGATQLWHSGHLWVSTVRTGNEASPIYLSVDSHPISREFQGWVAGVYQQHALLVQRGESGLNVVSVGAEGEPQVLGQLPSAGWDRYSVTSTGSVIAASFQAGTYIIDQGGDVRKVPDLAMGDEIVALASDPKRPRTALVLHQWSGQLKLILLNTMSAAVDTQIDLEPKFGRDRYATFNEDGEVVLLSMFELDRYAGQQHYTVKHAILRPNSLVFRPDSTGFAYSHDFGGGHGALSSGCMIYLRDMQENSSRETRLLSLKNRCRTGVGMAFVDGDLWVAPQ